VLIIDDPSTWPDRVKELLDRDEVVELLRQNDYMDELYRHPSLRPVLEEIEEYIAKTPLAAYHCTKQLPERPYSTTGLRVLDFGQHHSEVRELFRTHKEVSPALFKRIDAGLADWRKHHTGRREKMLWLCVDRSMVFDHGTESFFKYFGGEAVYFAFMKDPEVGPLLERIGEPVVVEVRISSRDLQVFEELAFARTLASHFASSVNPEFFIEGREGYLSKGIEPKDVVTVHQHSQFVKKFGAKRKR
jgi:hypothetical protein